MTKTIEELEADVEAATQAEAVAKTALRDAEKALRDARTDESGLRGHVLEGKPWFGGKPVRILVVHAGTGWRGKTALGHTLRKDGSYGARSVEMVINEASDLGLYAEVYPGREAP